MNYILSDKSNDCIFCTLPPAKEDEKNFILFQGSKCFVIMNIFPYNNGHLMVSPYRHIDCITKFTPDEMSELGVLTQKCVSALREVYEPNGFNLGINLGKEGGAGFDEHVHNHIVPRWTGDTNFMPILGETKIHPELLQETYARLSPLFKNL